MNNFLDQIPFFAISKNGQKSIFDVGKMQFHEKKLIYLISRVFWPGLFKIFWPTVHYLDVNNNVNVCNILTSSIPASINIQRVSVTYLAPLKSKTL